MGQPTYPYPGPLAPPPAIPPRPGKRWTTWWSMTITIIVLLLGAAAAALGVLFIVTDQAEAEDMFDGLGVVIGAFLLIVAAVLELPWVLYLWLRRMWLFVVGSVLMLFVVVAPLLTWWVNRLAAAS